MKKLFSIGTTSYIYPDTILANALKLKGRAEDIELLAFESASDGNIPTRAELGELAGIKNECGISYTLHLPLDIELGSIDDVKRRQAVEACVKFMGVFGCLEPYAYVLHCNYPREILHGWLVNVGKSISEIIKRSGVDPGKIALENLSYKFCVLDNIIKKYGLTCCIDIGHLLTAGEDLGEYFGKYIHNTAVIHLHGVNNGRDHVSLKYLDKNTMDNIMGLIIQYRFKGVLTLEVFSENDYLESDIIVKRYLNG